jgi:hypothetical protein
MKRFLIKTTILATIIYALAWGLDYTISRGLLQMEDYRFMSWSDMLDGNINADVIILGNSRGFSHFEPWTIDSICRIKTYCLGLGGYPINVELLKYHCYLLHNTMPRYIIQQVDYMTMQLLDVPHQHQSEQFLPLIYDGGMHDELLRVGYTWKDLYMPLYRYWGYQMVIKNGLLEALGVKHYVSDPSRMGHHYERGAWDGTELARMDTIMATMDAPAMRLFEQYLQKCYDDSINVILVNSPTYIGATNKTIGLEKVNVYFDSIATAYNTVYWNYTENYDLCNDTSNFCVSVHMNPIATHEFSMHFAEDLKVYLDSIDSQK